MRRISDRILKPMIRAKITDPWREVSWDEAIDYAAREFKRIQAQYGRDAVGGITSSRCTNEEAYLVQKLVRAAFGNNNVDTCARVCHSPTGYGLKHTLGESAGTQAFTSVMKSDVILLIGANPTEGHPVFASQLKRRLRAGREAHRRRSARDCARAHAAHPGGLSPAAASGHERRADECAGARHRHRRPDASSPTLPSAASKRPMRSGRRSLRIRIARRKRRPTSRAFLRRSCAAPRVCMRRAGNGAIYYGLGVTEHSQGTTMVMCIANLAMATGNLGREGVGVNPLRGQNNVQGSCDMGSFPHELSGYRHISDDATRALFESAWDVTLDAEPGLRIPNMFEAALDGSFKGMYIQGEDMAQSDPNTQHVTAALSAMECVVVQDLFLNETAKYAHVFLPGSSFLEKDGTFTNAERRISRVRKVMQPLAGLQDWEVTMRLSNALGYPMHYAHPSEIMAEIAALTPTFAGVSYEKLDRLGSIQWPCNASRADRARRPCTSISFVRGKGKFFVTEYVPTSERTTSRFPLILTTGRVLTQYNVGAQTRRTDNVVWHDEDRLEIHPHDAETRGIATAIGSASQAAQAKPCCARWSPIAYSRAWSTRRSISRSRVRTSSRRKIRIGRPTVPSTR